jgi:hypothetical protein
MEDQEEKEQRPNPSAASGNPYLVRYRMDAESN